MDEKRKKLKRYLLAKLDPNLAIVEGIKEVIEQKGQTNVTFDGVEKIYLKGDKGEPGYTPIKGKDYFDGIDGKTPSKEELESIIKPLIPKPKNGIDGVVNYDIVKDIVSDLIPKQIETILPAQTPGVVELQASKIVDLLSNLPEEEKLSMDAIRGSEDWANTIAQKMNYGIARTFVSLIDSPGFLDPGKSLRVNAAGTQLEYYTPIDTGAVWGNITGNLPEQTDLQTALDSKLPLSGGTMTGTLEVNEIKSVASTPLVITADQSDLRLELNGAAGAFKFTGLTGFAGTVDFESLTANRTYTFPDKTGTIALLDDITAGGLNTQLQYNNAGVLGGISGATSNGTSVTFSSGALLGINLRASGSAGIEIQNSLGTNVIIAGAGGGTGISLLGTTNIGSGSDFLRVSGGSGFTLLAAEGSSASANLQFQAKGTTGIITLATNSTERWRVAANGILQSNGAQTIQTSTGNLTLGTNGGNGNVIISPNGTGVVQLTGARTLRTSGGVLTLGTTGGDFNIRLTPGGLGTIQMDRIDSDTPTGTFNFLMLNTSGNLVRRIDAVTALSFIGVWGLNGNSISGTNFIGSTNNLPLNFRTNNILRWNISTSGVLESDGSQTIRTSTGNLTLATNGGNGNIILSPHGAGIVSVSGSISVGSVSATGALNATISNITIPINGANSLLLTNGSTEVGSSQVQYMEFQGDWWSGQPNTKSPLAKIGARHVTNGFRRGAIVFETSKDGTYSEDVRINWTGNTLFGTTSDNGADRIQVNGSSLIGNIRISTNTISSTNTNGDIIFSPNGSGNVGIGTTTPTNLLDVNSNSIRVRTARTPASASASGNQGEIAWDSDYMYVCIATNTWKRVAITTW